MNELEKLKKMLNDSGIPFIVDEENFIPNVIICSTGGRRLCDAILLPGQSLLEIMGAIRIIKTKGEITMLFKITKASYFTNEWSFNERFKEENKPCKNAFLKVYENGNKEWAVEINTLEDLLSLRKEVNEELVIGLNDTITIYNDFIE